MPLLDEEADPAASANVGPAARHGTSLTFGKNMPIDKSQQMCKRLTKLCFADYTFRQAKRFAEHIIESQIDPTDLIFSPHFTGLVVTYAKNFASSQGMGELPREYRILPEPILQHTHDRLLQARNELYAHRDVIAAQYFVYDDPISESAYDVKIRFSPETGVSFHPLFPELNPDILHHTISLCEFQSQRLFDEIKEILPVLTEGKKYEKNKFYTIGKDFP